MDGHLSFLRTACRLCGKVLSGKSDFADKSLFKNELLNQFRINIEKDLEEIHPNSRDLKQLRRGRKRERNYDVACSRTLGREHRFRREN